MRRLNSELTKRTNVRLPSSLHDALKKAAIERRTTIERLVQQAVERELGGGRSGPQAAPDFIAEITPLVRELNSRFEALITSAAAVPLEETAVRFLQYLPAPAVIKNLHGKIEWCNVAFEQLVGDRLQALKGHTTKDILRLSRHHESVEHIQELAAEGGTATRIEKFEIRGRLENYLTHRVRFSRASRSWIGDVSFPIEDCKAALNQSISSPVLFDERFHRGVADFDVHLLVAFLNALPTAALLKGLDGRVVWSNLRFCELAGGREVRELVGKRCDEIFRSDVLSTVSPEDEYVVGSKRALLASEALPHSPSWTSVRFPIYDSKQAPELIGVVSTEVNKFCISSCDASLPRG